MFKRQAAVVMGLCALSGIAQGQAITVTNQNRYLHSELSYTTSGDTVVNDYDASPESGDYGSWDGRIEVFGAASSTLYQNGGYDGNGTIEVDTFSMNFSCGGGPDSSGDVSAANYMQYTFTVSGNQAYTLSASLGTGPLVYASLEISGPSFYERYESNAGDQNIDIQGETGTFTPGEYTITMQASGEVSFTGPGGNGSGAGGNPPALMLVVAPACRADFNDDGFLDFFDFNDFVTCFEGGDCPPGKTADYNGDGFPDFFDFNDFVNDFEAGC